MARQLSVAVRNARVDAYESTIGTGARLRIWTGAQPATCATANSGVELADMTLPSDWLTAASAGSKTILGVWSDTANATGTPGHFRIYDSSGATCHDQGTVTLTAGGGDMTLDSMSVTIGQTITITSFTITDANS